MDANRSVYALQDAKRNRGFPLIELLVAVAVSAILLSVGMPSYREYQRRGAVEDVTSALSAGRVAAEQYFLDNRTYLGAPCPGAIDAFALSCEFDVFEYQLTATGLRIMTGFVYTLDESGNRTTAGPWGSGACWLARQGDSC